MCCPHFAGLEPASDSDDHHAAEGAEVFEADPNGNDNQITSRHNSAQENIKEYQDLLNQENGEVHGHSLQEVFIH
jgi:hypothetical protein